VPPEIGGARCPVSLLVRRESARLTFSCRHTHAAVWYTKYTIYFLAVHMRVLRRLRRWRNALLHRTLPGRRCQRVLNSNSRQLCSRRTPPPYCERIGIDSAWNLHVSVYAATDSFIRGRKSRIAASFSCCLLRKKKLSETRSAVNKATFKHAQFRGA